MISYAPFWETLKRSKESTYTLIKYYGISGSTINRLRKNLPVNTTTVNDLCMALKCDTQDIMTYVPSDNDQFL